MDSQKRSGGSILLPRDRSPRHLHHARDRHHFVLLLGNLGAAPITTLLVCFSLALTGSVLVGVAKWSMFRQGLCMSFGSAGMSRGMRAFYRLGWALMIIGTAITLLRVAVVLRH